MKTNRRLSEVFKRLLSGKPKAWALPLWVIALFFVSCLNQEVCEDVETVPVRMGFYALPPDAEEPQQILIDSLTIAGLSKDSLIYDNVYNVSQIELPLDSGSDTTVFIFRFPGEEFGPFAPVDTMWIYYERMPNLVSMECGFVTFFSLLNIRHSRLLTDSVVISRNNVENSFDEHVKIFPFVVFVDD